MRAILTYHSIDPSGSPISVDPAAFRRHLEWLDRSRVRVMSLDRLLAAPEAEEGVALTFDDGFANFATDALPLLAERGWPATVFVVTDAVGGTNAWEGRADPRFPTLPLLDWEGLGRAAERGVALESHTRRHPRLSTVPPDRLADELEGSAERLERETGRRPTWLAYPYGDLDPAVAGAAGRTYTGAVTTEHRPLGVREDRLAVPRLDAFYFRGPHGLGGWGTAGFRGAIWLRRQARRVRAALAAGRRG